MSADIKNVEDYIGDGVYVVFNGTAFSLDLREQKPAPQNRIVLEQSELWNLLLFLRDMKERFCTLNPDIKPDLVVDCKKFITL